ncbi:MAG TPA: universal stress protein [Acidimicrobiales bacterium]|nr:universal stress protein [Acidimicrobiales bacterium]
MQHIVVGVDGSTPSRRALRWAVDHARTCGAAVEVVHAWTAPEVGGDRLAQALSSPAELEHEARRELDDVLAGVDESGLADRLTSLLAHGEAAAALLDAGDTADLVVVGTRGLSGRTDGDAGSVCTQLIRHARCPVVVVPD